MHLNGLDYKKEIEGLNLEAKTKKGARFAKSLDFNGNNHVSKM